MKMFDLTGKVAVVTGGGTGLGEAAARALAEAGASVVLSGRRLENLEKVAADIQSNGGQALPVAADVSRREDVESMAAEALRAYGKIDILVNNAGINIVKPFLDLTEEEWDAVINTNLKGCFHCCQAIGKGMVEQGSGSIINMVSVFGLRGFMNLAPYVASKGRKVMRGWPSVRMTRASVSEMFSHSAVKGTARVNGSS